MLLLFLCWFFFVFLHASLAVLFHGFTVCITIFVLLQDLLSNFFKLTDANKDPHNFTFQSRYILNQITLKNKQIPNLTINFNRWK